MLNSSSQVTITIDTYQFVNNLTEAGFSKEQAEAVLDEITKINFQNVASKDDISRLDKRIGKLEIEIHKIKFDIIKWVVPLILGLYGLIIFKMF